MQAAVDKLSDAHALCKALTVDPIAVEELLRLGAPEEGAIVALRKSNGDVQRAAGEILDQVEARRQASKDRARQRHLGLTADKTGYVDLARIDTVKDFLAVDSEVAVALLRLANNDIDRAANLWHECHRAEHLVLQRADAISSKRPKRALPSHAAGAAAANLPPVDEVALVTLVSTGVDRHLAESALRSTAGRGSDPVEAALEWLTGGEGIPRTDEGARAGAGGTGGNHEAVLAHDDQDASREGSDVSSDTSDDLSDDRMDGDEQLQEEAKHREAFETFQRELGDSLQRQEIGEEHLGLKLEEELYFIEKYLGLAQSTRDTAK